MPSVGSNHELALFTLEHEARHRGDRPTADRLRAIRHSLFPRPVEGPEVEEMVKDLIDQLYGMPKGWFRIAFKGHPDGRMVYTAVDAALRVRLLSDEAIPEALVAALRASSAVRS
jgi:hypothetical protein